MKTIAPFKRALNNVFVHTSTCSVYVIKRGRECIMIDCGDGSVLGDLGRIGVSKVSFVLFTHHHAEQCQGHRRFEKAGIPLYAPEAGRRLFSDPVSARQMFPTYTCEGALHIRSLAEKIKITRFLDAFDVLRWKDIEITVMPAQGNSEDHTIYNANLNNKRVTFAGDLIYAGAKIINFYDMDWDYGFGGGLDAQLTSLSLLRADFNPQTICPSHGPVIRKAPSELDKLTEKIENFRAEYVRHWDLPHWNDIKHTFSKPSKVAGFRRIGKRVFKATQSNLVMVIADDGAGFFADGGIWAGDYKKGYKWLDERIKDFKRHYGLKKIVFATPSHYHWDHIDALYHLRKGGAEIWALDEMTDVIEHPARYNLTCLINMHPTMGRFGGIKIDRRLSHGETINWHGLKLTFVHLPGQTYYAQGLLLAADGKRIAFTGDNIFPDKIRSGHDGFITRNEGILEEGYLKCARVLKKLKPDLILNGHSMDIADMGQIGRLERWAKSFRKVMEGLSPWPSYEYWCDPYFAEFFPYRHRAKPGKSFKVDFRLRNHLKRAVTATAQLVLPRGWQTDNPIINANISPSSTASHKLIITPSPKTKTGLAVIQADLTYDGMKMGRFAECLIDVK